jgi:protease-4|uniref:Signal peptide peptidase SppA n=1 Tax=candidate division WOR-3 bacterium TaxID=2052148 RepID=A0A7C6EEP4_UNCW3
MRKSTFTWLIILGVIVYLLIGTFFITLLTNPAHKISSFSKALALIEVEGVIIDSRPIVRQLKNYGKNPKVAAIVLRIDSPGGGVGATQEIYAEIKRTKEKGKKIIVSMGPVAASGGYYIATPADLIVANPGTITGSIGVIMEFPILSNLLEKLGIKFEVIKSSEHKDIGSPFRTMSAKERALLKDVVTSVYDQFIAAVVENRKIPESKVRAIADGRILSGAQAKDLGLVDTLGSMEDAIEIAASMVGIKGEPQVLKERKRMRLADWFLGSIMRNFFIPELKYILD